jgi:nucleotide-binding universal stress UspA family protein
VTTFDRMLVPLDGSHLAESVLPVTQVMAGRLGATILLLHVLEHDAPQTIHGERHLTNLIEAETYVRHVARGLESQGIQVETHIHPNPQESVVESITEHAREHQADLVILATHGSGGMRDLLLGSIAQQVLKQGAVPVLLVKPAADGEPPRFLGRNVLVPLDGTETHVEAVLPIATEVAQGLGATLHLAMVVPTLSTLSAERSASAILSPRASAEALDIREKDAAEYLGQIALSLRHRGRTVETRVLRGEPAEALLEAAQASRADLIVMSTHGRAGWAAFWSGSVGPRILARIEQPLLLVRIPG